MEVHRHAHNHGTQGGKKWTHYLWEFFMLFLAVFCGFLAEWQLERTIEHQREKQFIRSLAEDLKKDTLQVRLYRSFNQNLLKYCDSVQHCIRTTDIFKNSNKLYDYSKELARFWRYYPTDRTIQQLKNAGNMRLIRKWDISNAITDYYSQTKFLTELDQQLNEQTIKYRGYLIEFMDLTSYDKLNPAGSFMDSDIKTSGNPGFIINDIKEAKMLYNQAFTLKIFLGAVESSSETLLAEGGKLLALLQKEYHLR